MSNAENFSVARENVQVASERYHKTGARPNQGSMQHHLELKRRVKEQLNDAKSWVGEIDKSAADGRKQVCLAVQHVGVRTRSI